MLLGNRELKGIRMFMAYMCLITIQQETTKGAKGQLTSASPVSALLCFEMKHCFVFSFWGLWWIILIGHMWPQ